MTTTESPTIALLGTGTMGLPIGLNLVKAGLTVRAWNRSADKAKPLVEAGATVRPTPAEAVEGAGVVITMLFDAESVAEVIEQAKDKLERGTTWIQLSTVGVAGSQDLQARAGELGLVYVDAPVLGTKKPAEDGKLTVLASGPEEAKPVCQPVFDAIAASTLWVGPAGNGSKLKLVANAWVLTVLEGIAESLTLAQRLGLDPSLFLDAVRGGAMDAPYVQLKGRGMLEEQWEPSFALSGAAKDAGLIVQAGEDVGLELPFAQAAQRYLADAIEQGHGDKDMAAIYLADREL